MATAYRARLRYSEAMVRRAVRVFVWRRLRRMLWIEVVLVAAVLLGWRAWPLIAGTALTLSALLLLTVLLVWRAHWRHSVGVFRAMDPPEADFSFDEQGLSARSSEGAVTLPWRKFAEAWEQPGFWMLLIGTNAFITLPLDGLPAEAEAFVRERFADRFRTLRP